MIYQKFVKPFADFLLAAAGILALLPFLLILAFMIGLRMGRPVLFRQTRIGLNNHRFTFLKFRTMTDERDPSGHLLPDDQRLTSLGRFLRSSSLDELPQLWNVVKGEMSLIGPRPLLPEYLPRYSPEQRRRHEIKPGITGWAQVNGRNGISWEQKFRFDVWYVDHCSLALDAKILGLTLAAVLRRRGISQPGHATALPFTGSADHIATDEGRANA
jgi:sugar transferase EpsL